MITLYHGTDNKAADKILETRTFNKSKGDNHWLGDGVYFYKEKFDLIKAIFPHEDNDIPLNKTRLGYYPEVQYCVINTDIMGNISNDGKDDNNYLEFFSFAERYNESGNSNLITYKPKRKRIYK